MTRRVAVTGVGVVAPGGLGVPAFWDLLTAGRTATRGITLFDPAGFRSRIAAECDFDPLACGLSVADSERADRYVQFALVAAGRGGPRLRPRPGRGGPLADRGVAGHRGRRHHPAGARLRPGQRGRRALGRGPPRRPAPHLHRAFAPSALASEVAEQFGAHGPVQTVSTGCTSGLDAVGYAFHTIEEGRADVCIAGASDSPISPITVACFDAIKATSAEQRRPRARLPALRRPTATAS